MQGPYRLGAYILVFRERAEEIRCSSNSCEIEFLLDCTVMYARSISGKGGQSLFLQITGRDLNIYFKRNSE